MKKLMLKIDSKMKNAFLMDQFLVFIGAWTINFMYNQWLIHDQDDISSPGALEYLNHYVWEISVCGYKHKSLLSRMRLTQSLF